MVMMRGRDSEPIELRPGSGVRDAAHAAEVEQWAWRRVRALRLFYTHLTVYVVVNFVLFMIDSTSPGPMWFYRPLVGGGRLLCLHALQALEWLPWPPQAGGPRKVRELVEKHRPH